MNPSPTTSRPEAPPRDNHHQPVTFTLDELETLNKIHAYLCERTKHLRNATHLYTPNTSQFWHHQGELAMLSEFQIFIYDSISYPDSMPLFNHAK